MNSSAIKTVKIEFWNGAEAFPIAFSDTKNRKVDLFDPCYCGCDISLRENPDLLGFLSGSNNDGNGFTLPIYDQDTYDKMRKIFPLNDITDRQGLVDGHYKSIDPINPQGVYMTFETFDVVKDLSLNQKEMLKRIINIENRLSNVDILPKRQNKKRKKLISKMSLDELKKDGK